MPFTTQELEPIFQQMLSANNNRYTVGSNLTHATQYLTGETVQLPAFAATDFNYYFDHFASLLIAESTSMENRQLLIELLKEPVINSFCRSRIIDRMFGGKHYNTGFEMYEHRKSILLQLGLSENEIMISILDLYKNWFTMESLENNGTALHKDANKFYQEMPDHEIDDLINTSEPYWNETIAALLFLHHRNRFHDYADKLKNASSYDRPNPDKIAFVMKYDAEIYQPQLLEAIQAMPESTYRNIADKWISYLALQEHVLLGDELFRVANKYLESCLGHSRENFYEEYFVSTRYPSDSSRHSSIYLSRWALFHIAQKEESLCLEWLQRITDEKFFIEDTTISWIYGHFGEAAIPYIIEQLYLKDTYKEERQHKVLLPILGKHLNELVADKLWQFHLYKSRNAKQQIANLLLEHDKHVEQHAIAALLSSKVENRFEAAKILSQLNSVEGNSALKKSIETESDDATRNLMLEFADASYFDSINEHTLPTVIAAAQKRGKLKKPLVAWLKETELPPLSYQSGRQLGADEVRFMLYRLSVSGANEMKSDPEIRPIIHALEKGTSAAFAKTVFKLYKQNGYEAKYKFLLALCALLGDEEMVGIFTKGIEEWIDQNRKMMAELGIQALALQSSNKALRWIEWASRKYRSKKPNISIAALQALENAAEEMGVSIHELGDRIVPDFGFDGLFKIFYVDGQEFRGFIDSSFKIGFLNESNRKIKSIPAAADDAIKNEFKAIAKEAREIVKAQSPRLEYYLVIQRKWELHQWQSLFLNNPIMFMYATKLVWGTYKDNQLVGTFICNDDTSLLNHSGDEVELTDGVVIGIVHPAQISKELLEQWKKQLYQLSVEQVFPQLSRDLPNLDDIDMSKAILHKYVGKQMAMGSIRSTLEKNGWHKGPTGDGGYLESFKLYYPEKQLEVVLELSGVGAGYGWGSDEKLGRLYILDKTKITSKWIGYIKDDSDEKLVPFHSVPEIFLTEVLAAINSIKAVTNNP